MALPQGTAGEGAWVPPGLGAVKKEGRGAAEIGKQLLVLEHGLVCSPSHSAGSSD